MQDNNVVFPHPLQGERVPYPRYHLPSPLTPMVGREQDVAAVCALLSRPEVRLVTLTGTGGVGKTRLALSIAASIRAAFSDGVCLVPLASIRDSELVLSTLAEFLGLRPGRAPVPLEMLSLALQEKHLLMLLDNVEQILGAAPRLVDLLQDCPRLKLLVTSRAVLHAQGEYEYSVSPLALPDRQGLDDVQALSQCASVMLFVQRVQALLPDFTLTSANARAVAGICLRLDGLPLALELAAARSKLLPPQALLDRLSPRLALLTSPALDVPARQQTLRNTLDWSYNLLSKEEQRLFRRFAVFVGGCQLQAAEAVCAPLPGDEDPESTDESSSILDTIGSLIDKSLVQQTSVEGGEPRLTMLETVREYGWECLQQNKEAEAAKRAQALYYLAFAEEAVLHLRSAQQGLWRGRLQREQDNLRAALGFLIEQGEAELAVQLSGALWFFWYMLGLFHEGSTLLERALRLPEGGRTEYRARALCGAGSLAFREGNYIIAAALLEESKVIYLEHGDRAGAAEVLLFLAMVRAYQRDHREAECLLEQSMRLCREVGDWWLQGWVLDSAARVAWKRDDARAARAFLEESAAIARQINQNWALSSSRQLLAEIALAQGEYEHAAAMAQEMMTITRKGGDKAHLFDALFTLGEAALRLGDEQEALARYQESLALARETSDQANVSRVTTRLGDIALQRGDDTAALNHYRNSLALARAFDHQIAAGKALLGLAHVFLARGQYQQAALFLSAVEERLDAATEMHPPERAGFARAATIARAHLDEQAYLKAREEGRSLSLGKAQLLAEQIDVSESVSSRPPHTHLAGGATARTIYPAHLSKREVEVLRLVAEGLTNEQIAAQLVISYRTVTTHLNSIYTKLGVNSRSAATRFAVEQHLV